MAWSQPPDQQERYQRKVPMTENLILVVKHYDGFPEVVTYHFEDNNQDVYDAGQATIEEINEMIKAEGWELLQ